MERMLVFLYGTLKTGQPNHHLLLAAETGRAEPVGPALTRRQLPLVIASRYNIPYLLDLPGRGHRIHGELYAVDHAKLAWLDEFEGVPNHYERRQEAVERLHKDGAADGDGDGGDVTAFVYLLRHHKPFMLHLPMLDDYSSDGPHGLPYKEEEDDLNAAEDIDEINA
ncbi:Gamma-glutamylaminecyclotransferase [Amphibalanus amphitrite]|uniref:Gamma-glutamylcyclotransferase family protein n=1 Tax=Amphibalanus amphitrite TaxID=1232801 RepID=A0A6A4WKD5_AMPAM|nr:Gamma-glutamylaminecyclotransferase [Amphibalanus amphitrite]